MTFMQDTPAPACEERARESRPELRILSGLHRGAAIYPGKASLSVGSDPGCDIVLLDEGVQGEHLVLEPLSTPGHPTWQVFVSDRAARATDAQGSDWTSGATLAEGELIGLGEVWLCITPANAPWMPPPAILGSAVPKAPDESRPMPRRRMQLPRLGRKSAWLTGTLALLTTGVLLVFWGVMPIPSLAGAAAATGGWASPAQAQSPETAEAAEAESPTRVPTANALSNATVEARRLFKERGLVQVSVAVAAGQLRIDAELDESQRVKFENALIVLDKRLGGAIDIQAQMVQPKRDLPFTVQQVLMGPASRVVLSDGRILRVGESADGVKLTAVRPGKLQFMARRAVEVPW